MTKGVICTCSCEAVGARDWRIEYVRCILDEEEIWSLRVKVLLLGISRLIGRKRIKLRQVEKCAYSQRAMIDAQKEVSTGKD